MMSGVLGLGVMAATATSDTSIPRDAGFAKFLETFREGTQRFMNGDPALWKENVSRRPDVMIMGAWGGYEKGWPEVSARYDWAAARFEESGARLKAEYLASEISGDLAYTVAIERADVKVVGQETVRPIALRVTHVYRRENGAWKLMLRHADPLMQKTKPEATFQ
jgi:ketosteroid isomerase-like protein